MSSLEEIRATRLEKLQLLIKRGINPYPINANRDLTLGKTIEQFNELSLEQRIISLVGRIMSVREQGKIIFLDFNDGTGKLQALLREGDPLRAEQLALFREVFDIGDFIEIKGKLFLTKRGEKTILAEEIRMLAKSLRPLPEKWHGLENIETRFRERELDILSDQEVKKRFVVRSRVISSIRRFVEERGFIECETPILQEIPGGANARPFVTHHQALDIDLYLRIATEIHLKRLIVAGFERVYEIGRLFRNEGIDHAHNPEFTTIELYWAYAKSREFVDFLEALIRFVIMESTGSLEIKHNGATLDFGRAWPRLTFRDLVLAHTGINIDKDRNLDDLIKAVKEKDLKIDFSKSVSMGDHYDELFKKMVRPALKEPTWVLDYPLELKPLANKSPSDSTKNACAQLIVSGGEIINAYYHELNDPIDQRKRFEEQEQLRQKGSEEAQRIDEQFLKSLEYGMPPTSGMGLGIDRLVMLLTNTKNIREVILFPTLKPRG